MYIYIYIWMCVYVYIYVHILTICVYMYVYVNMPNLHKCKYTQPTVDGHGRDSRRVTPKSARGPVRVCCSVLQCVAVCCSVL